MSGAVEEEAKVVDSLVLVQGFVLVVFDVKMWGVVRRPAVDSSREVDEDFVFGAAGLRFAVKGVLYRTIQNFAAC